MTTTGRQIRDARERVGLTQEQLAQRVGVSGRTVGNWERGETVPRNRLAKVREVLPGVDDQDDRTADLRSASDAEVLAEIARRFARGQEGSGEHVRSAATSRAAGSAANDLTPHLDPGEVIVLPEKESGEQGPPRGRGGRESSG